MKTLFLRIRLAAFVIALGALMVAAVYLPDRPEARYQEYPCQFAEIYRGTGPVDLAVFGNSRSKRAIVAEQLAAAFAAKTDDAATTPVVLDLSRDWRGQAHQFVLVRDALEARGGDFAALSVEYNTDPGKSRRYHPRIAFQARSSDLLELALVDDELGIIEKPAQILKWLLERAALRLELLLTGDWLPLDALPVTVSETRDCTETTDRILAERNLRVRKQRADKWRTQSTTWNPATRQQQINTTYTRRIIAEARKHDVAIGLHYIPALMTAPVDRKFAATVAAGFSVPFHVPGDRLLGELYTPGGFRDPTHMTPAGSGRYGAWLGAALAADRAGAVSRQADD